MASIVQHRSIPARVSRVWHSGWGVTFSGIRAGIGSLRAYRLCIALHRTALTWTSCTEDGGTSRALHFIKVTSALHELHFISEFVIEIKLKRIKRVLTAKMYRDEKRENC